jgi:hypothetical protein
MGPISLCFITVAVKASQEEIVKLIWHIRKLGRKLSVVNTDPGPILAMLHFLCNLLMGQISYSVLLLEARMACQEQTL